VIDAATNDWYVYMLRCADTTLYTGITNDLSVRLAAHNAGRGAKYTRGRLPVELVYRERVAGRGAALRREAELKRLPATTKRKLASSGS
jgi:putative endonuclease